MPFTKTGPDRYKSPSGRTFSKAQVRLYYASGGFKPSKMKKMRIERNK
jgi:hypothetical protein